MNARIRVLIVMIIVAIGGAALPPGPVAATSSGIEVVVIEPETAVVTEGGSAPTTSLPWLAGQLAPVTTLPFAGSGVDGDAANHLPTAILVLLATTSALAAYRLHRTSRH